jgi:hypothetical protein
MILGALLTIISFNGCGDTTVAPASDNLSFSAYSSQDSVGDAQDYFILDTVKILIKDIKVHYANTSNDSANFKVGPFVLFLNLTSNVNFIATGLVPAGNYRKIKFEVHKLEDAEAIPDPEFADSNGRYSVIVKGWYMGNYFVYKSSKSAHQILNFPADIGIASDRSTNVTLLVKPYIWFIKDGVYLDPLNPVNSNDIDNNIKDNINHNFKAFRDDDKNGLPD